MAEAVAAIAAAAAAAGVHARSTRWVARERQNPSWARRTWTHRVAGSAHRAAGQGAYGCRLGAQAPSWARRTSESAARSDASSWRKMVCSSTVLSTTFVASSKSSAVNSNSK